MRKRKSKSKWMTYPPTNDFRTGIKVGWRTYKTRAEAELCASAAKHNALLQMAAGYDFGYCCPGSIDEKDGKFEVCIP